MKRKEFLSSGLFIVLCSKYIFKNSKGSFERPLDSLLTAQMIFATPTYGSEKSDKSVIDVQLTIKTKVPGEPVISYVGNGQIGVGNGIGQNEALIMDIGFSPSDLLNIRLDNLYSFGFTIGYYYDDEGNHGYNYWDMDREVLLTFQKSPINNSHYNIISSGSAPHENIEFLNGPQNLPYIEFGQPFKHGRHLVPPYQ